MEKLSATSITFLHKKAIPGLLLFVATVLLIFNLVSERGSYIFLFGVITFYGAVLFKTRHCVFVVADEVLLDRNALTVRRAGISFSKPIAEIAKVSYRKSMTPPQIEIEFHGETLLGRSIFFIPRVQGLRSQPVKEIADLDATISVLNRDRQVIF